MTENILEELFGHGVDVRRCFIEDEDFWATKNRSDKGNQLFLTKTHGITAGSQFCIKTFVKSRKESFEMRFVDDFFEFYVRVRMILFVAIEDIFSDSSGEEHGFLEDKSDLLSTLFCAIATNIATI